RVEQAIVQIESAVPSDVRRIMRLLVALGTTALHTQDPGSAKAVGALTKALELAEHVGDAEYCLRAMWGLYIYRFRMGDYRSALMLAERFRGVATEPSAPSDVLVGERLIGVVRHVLGDQSGARRHIQPLVAADLSAGRQSHILRYQYDQRVISHSHYA